MLTEGNAGESAGLPRVYAIPNPNDVSRCRGCPYPGVGFICWGRDGSCMRTDMERINKRRKGQVRT